MNEQITSSFHIGTELKRIKKNYIPMAFCCSFSSSIYISMWLEGDESGRVVESFNFVKIGKMVTGIHTHTNTSKLRAKDSWPIFLYTYSSYPELTLLAYCIPYLQILTHSHKIKENLIRCCSIFNFNSVSFWSLSLSVFLYLFYPSPSPSLLFYSFLEHLYTKLQNTKTQIRK